ncbi:hypothetical protein [Hahella ganghwensis]|uniref:hypothetical protein n=1 Tax=Hahella ganghwensis TaxID=286420 RepID=UPI00035FE3C6|nr:hypothetical protein [Hahella ganghwensis]
MIDKVANEPTIEAPLCPMETWAKGICNGLAVVPGVVSTLNGKQALRCWVYEAKTRGRLRVLETLGKRHRLAKPESLQPTQEFFFYWDQALEVLGERAFAITSANQRATPLDQIGFKSPTAVNAVLIHAKRCDQILLATMVSLLHPSWGTLLAISHGVCSQSDIPGRVMDHHYESVLEGLLI